MISPSVGRVVWFHLNGAILGGPVVQRDQPLDAHVVYVWNDRMINVAGFDADGTPFRATSVTMRQEGDPVPPYHTAYAEWMPYQVGQAKKHEAEKAAT